jgi:hypothetical protein
MDMRLKEIKEQIAWGKENLEIPTDNLEPEQIEYLITQAEKLDAIAKAWVRIETGEEESSFDFYIEVQDILSESY